MALADWQIQIYLDTFDVYRLHKDGNNKALGYRLISSGNFTNAHETPNFDEPRGSVVAKENNIFTANRYPCDIECDVRASDLILLHLRGDTGGSPARWRTVQGDPRTRSLLPRKDFYGVPTNPPVTVT